MKSCINEMKETQPDVSVPTYRRLQYVLLAACILIAPMSLSAWLALCPQYGNPACPTNADPLAALTAFRAANPQLMPAFLFLTIVIPYVYPLSCIGLGLVPMKRSPWLSTIGIACGLVGSVPWGYIADQTFQLNAMARLGNDPLFAMVERNYFSNWEITVVAGGWVLGHLVAYLLLGLALARSRAVPLWAAALIVISVPLMGPIAYGSGNGNIQVAGFALVFLGSIPAAFALLKRKE